MPRIACGGTRSAVRATGIGRRRWLRGFRLLDSACSKAPCQQTTTKVAAPVPPAAHDDTALLSRHCRADRMNSLPLCLPQPTPHSPAKRHARRGRGQRLVWVRSAVRDGSHTCGRTLCDQIFVRPGLRIFKNEHQLLMLVNIQKQATTLARGPGLNQMRAGREGRPNAQIASPGLFFLNKNRF